MTDERWLPPRPRAPGEARHRPWVPETLEDVIDPGELESSWAYVVVDEIVGDRIGLSVAHWPRVDSRGRLHFADTSRDELLGTSRRLFQIFVDGHRVALVMVAGGELSPRDAANLRRRPLRIGDTFAIPYSEIDDAKGTLPRGPSGQPGDSVFDPTSESLIYDISYEAREEAKVAGAAAVAAPLDADEAERFLGSEHPEEQGPEGEGPTEGGPGGSPPPEPPRPARAGPGGSVRPAEQVAEMRG